MSAANQELSRDDKKLQQLIALIEKQEQQQKRKQEKKKQQELNQQQQIIKKSQSVAVTAPIKQKPKVSISYAPGALEQNSRYMHQQKVSVQKANLNWYSWGPEKDDEIDETTENDELKGINGASYEPNKRLKHGTQNELYSDSLEKDSQSQAKINEQGQEVPSVQNKSASNPSLLQEKIPDQTCSQTNEKNSKQKSSTSQEDQKTDQSNKQDNKNSQQSSVDLRENDTFRIFEATQKLQNEMKLSNLSFGKPYYQDQLYLTLKEGRSLKTALLIKARTKALQQQVQMINEQAENGRHYQRIDQQISQKTQ